MEGDAYLTELVVGIIYVLAGARLSLLGARTGEIPERLLGASFVLMGMSGVIYGFATLDFLMPWWTPLNFSARVAYLPGAVLVAVFTARVFRADSRWARALVWVVSLLVTAGVSVSVVNGDWEGFSLSSVGFWLEWVGYTLPFGWAATEAFIQYQQARKRVRVGLCEPSVCNRMFLWSAFGFIQLVGCAVVIGQYAAFERENSFSATWDILYGMTLFAALVVMWIAFFPPKVYIRWLNQGVGALEAVES
jgi:hypothetical protein